MSQDLAPSLAPSYPPSAELARNARVSGRAAYDRLVAEADADPQAFWGRLAREFVAWKRPFTRVLDESRAPFYEWFNDGRSEEHTSELQSQSNLVCRLLLEKKKKTKTRARTSKREET